MVALFDKIRAHSKFVTKFLSQFTVSYAQVWAGLFLGRVPQNYKTCEGLR